MNKRLKVEKLVPEIKDIKVTAYDIYGKKHTRDLKNFQFRVSVYGILVKGDKILMQRNPRFKNKYGLPGGGVHMHESISETLVREFEEETGIQIKVGNLFHINESFFFHDNLDVHSVMIYYFAEEIGGVMLKNGNGEDTAEVKYMKLEDLIKQTTNHVFWPVIKMLKKFYK